MINSYMRELAVAKVGELIDEYNSLYYRILRRLDTILTDYRRSVDNPDEAIHDLKMALKEILAYLH